MEFIKLIKESTNFHSFKGMLLTLTFLLQHLFLYPFWLSICDKGQADPIVDRPYLLPPMNIQHLSQPTLIPQHYLYIAPSQNINCLEVLGTYQSYP